VNPEELDYCAALVDTFGYACAVEHCEEDFRTVGIEWTMMEEGDSEPSLVLLPLCEEHLFAHIRDLIFGRRLAGHLQDGEYIDPPNG
jgi:hypothetical protein